MYRYGLGGTPEEQAAYNALTCPAGYSKRMFNIVDGVPVAQITAGNQCVNKWGLELDAMADPQIAALSASHDSELMQSRLLMAGGAAGLLLLDGPMKLAGAALIAYGWMRGAFIGGL
jgi:hypothetical protein